MALEQLIQASKVQQITMVNDLPSADATEYDKHLLYQKDEDLYFMRKYIGTAGVSSLGNVLSFKSRGWKCVLGYYNNYIYIIGSTDGNYQNNIMRYDINTNTSTIISTTTPFLIGSDSALFGQVNNKIYIFGFSTASSGKTYAFDMETETFTTLNTTWSYNNAHTINAAAVGNKILVAYKQYSNSTAYYTLYVYDTVADSKQLISSQSSSSKPVVNFCDPTGVIFVSDNIDKVYRFGENKNVMVYSLSANTFETKNGSTNKLTYGCGFYDNTTQKILLFPTGGKIFTYDTTQYTTNQESITLPDLTTENNGVNVNNAIYLVGFSNTAIDKYNFPGDAYGYKKITSEIV